MGTLAIETSHKKIIVLKFAQYPDPLAICKIMYCRGVGIDGMQHDTTFRPILLTDVVHDTNTYKCSKISKYSVNTSTCTDFVNKLYHGWIEQCVHVTYAQGRMKACTKLNTGTC